ncbi:MAG: EAL domain-containing protein [Rubrivivax sp.]
MPLIRQIRLLLTAVIALAVGGALVAHLMTTREALAQQVRLKNQDNAESLALVLSQQHGDLGRIGLVLRAQGDTGHYRLVRFEPAAGGAPIEQRFEAAPGTAPRWWRALLPIESEPGVAQVSDGWNAVGRVVVVTHVEHAYDSLWRGSRAALLWMALLALVAAWVGGAGVRRLQVPLEATVAQAEALSEGRYVKVELPQAPELRRVGAAMNSMVDRVRALFDTQAAESERWRTLAHCDALTGLPHRAHFIARLGALQEREDGADGGVLVLVRVADLEAANRERGREAVDAALRALGHALQQQSETLAEGVAGRLNGSDFACFAPAPQAAADLAAALAAALRPLLESAGLHAHLGAVALPSGHPAAEWLARADLALARAEAGEPFEPVLLAEGASAEATPAAGEQAWRERLQAALAAGRGAIAEFPLLAPDGRLLHLECPLRVALDPAAAPEPAARWLPLALRTRLTAAADTLALQLALAAAAADGRPRCVNVAAASLAEPDFVDGLRERLLEAPALAPLLWLELPEAAALQDRRRVLAFARWLRPLGVKVGLEHAGRRLHRVERLYEIGLDYVKLDAAEIAGAAHDAAVQAFVRSTVGLLAGIGGQVFAEGVADGADAQALWACGVAGVTGPWASAQRAPG